MSKLLAVFAVLVTARFAAAEPCVSRANGMAWRTRDAKVASGKLTFCTNDVCWAQDLKTRAYSTIPTIPKSAKPEADVDPSGRATATSTGVEFCPTGKGGACKKYSYKFKFEGAVSVWINAEGTLGAVSYAGISEEGNPTWVMLYDLAKPKEVKRLKGPSADVFSKTFWVGDTFYTAAGKKVGKLKVDYDSGPVRVGKTDLVAVTEKFDSVLTIVDTATAKVTQTVKLGFVPGKNDVIDPYQIAASEDGAQIYVVSGGPNTGETIAVDVATGKQLARTSPPVCAATK